MNYIYQASVCRYVPSAFGQYPDCRRALRSLDLEYMADDSLSDDDPFDLCNYRAQNAAIFEQRRAILASMRPTDTPGDDSAMSDDDPVDLCNYRAQNAAIFEQRLASMRPTGMPGDDGFMSDDDPVDLCGYRAQNVAIFEQRRAFIASHNFRIVPVVSMPPSSSSMPSSLSTVPTITAGIIASDHANDGDMAIGPVASMQPPTPASSSTVPTTAGTTNRGHHHALELRTPDLEDIPHILHEASQTCHIATDGCQDGFNQTVSFQEVVDNANALIMHLRPCSFKFGITANPAFRFYNSEYGYKQEGYSHMVVLSVGSPDLGKHLETALIARFHGVQGLQNINPGGENPPKHICFVYIVGCCAASGSLLKAAAQRRLCRSLCLTSVGNV